MTNETKTYAPLHFVVRVNGEINGRFNVFEDAQDAAVAAAKEAPHARVVVNFSAVYGQSGESEAMDFTQGSDDWDDYHACF